MRHMQNLHVWRILRSFFRGLLLSAVSIAALAGLVCGLIVIQGQRDEARQAGAAIVLGAAQWNGDPSPVLRARLDHALDLYPRGIVRKINLARRRAPGA